PLPTCQRESPSLGLPGKSLARWTWTRPPQPGAVSSIALPLSMPDLVAYVERPRLQHADQPVPNTAMRRAIRPVRDTPTPAATYCGVAHPRPAGTADSAGRLAPNTHMNPVESS